jgi:transcriptional regulator with XRE-family HTH domain
MNEKLFSTAGFILRIRSLMEREGIDHWNKFEAEIGMRGAGSRWKSGKDKPTPDSLLKIRKRFNVSIDWLLTGKGSGPPTAPLETSLLIKTLTVVEEFLNEERKELLPEQKARLIDRIFNDCAEDRSEPDIKMVKRYYSVMTP